MSRILMLIALFLLANASAAAVTTVDCDRGESLNRALARLDKKASNTVEVKGTCAEYVEVRGFEGLTLKGLPGATLVKPGPPPASGVRGILTIDSSRSVTVDGFKVQAPSDFTGVILSGVLVSSASANVRLRNLTVEGGVVGIHVDDNSQASIARVTGLDPGWATVGVFRSSAVYLEDSLFEGHAVGGLGWKVGISVEASSLTLHATTIRNMQVGMEVSMGGHIHVFEFDNFYPLGGSSEVVIESPLGNNFFGLQVYGGGVVSLATKLRITNAGQSWGGDSGGVVVRGGGKLDAYNHLEVTGSQGQGVYVANNSYVSLPGSSVTGGLNNGLVVLNQSTVTAAPFGGATTPAQISGNNRQDIFCDSRSLITFGANIANATNVQCSNLLAGASEPIP